MNFKKLTTILAMLFIVGLLVPGIAFANSAEVSEKDSAKENAAKHISEFMSDHGRSISALNKAAKAPVIDAEEYTLSNGDKVKKEFRKIKVDNDLTIINTRTYIISGTMYTVTDSYGLFWGGVPGAGGELVAVYKYSHPTINNPNSMTTKFHDADGYARNLDTQNYKFIYADGTWDPDESYNPSANVAFYMQVRSGFVWNDITYVNTCTFNSYGEASFSWS